VTDSPIGPVLRALDAFDAAAVAALMAPECKLQTADGRSAQGREAVATLVGEILGDLHSTAHEITDEWHPAGVFIAEVEASYELRDGLALKALPRVFILRSGPAGITDMRVYGAHERRLADHGIEDARGIRIGGRWMPPL
jgi:hypothetical protein